MQTPRPILQTDLIAAIEAHCARTGISPTEFGRSTVGNGSLLTSLRRGTDPRLSTVNRILEEIGG